MKKLIPALVLLLVSAMVLSTSSYAWFSMNRTVSATGMSLTSTAPANLLITNAVYGTTPASATWGATTAASETYAGKIYPSSTNDGVLFFALADGQKIGTGDIGGVVDGTGSAVTDGVVFYKGSDVYSASDANAPVAKLATGSVDTVTGYWVEYTLYLKTTGASALNVYLSSIDITTTYTEVTLGDGVDFTVEANQIYYVRTGAGTTESPYVYTLQTTGSSTAGTYYTKNTIDDCVRVAIFTVSGDTNTLVGIYDVGGSANDSVNPITAVVYDANDAGVEDDTFASYTASATDTASLVARDDTDSTKFADTATFVVAGDEVVTQLLVRVWIEGQNTKCVNNIAGQNFNIGLTFNIKADV